MEDEKNTCMEIGKSMYITSTNGLIGQYGKHEKHTSAHLVPGSTAEQRIHRLHRSLSLPPLVIGRESMRSDGPQLPPTRAGRVHKSTSPHPTSSTSKSDHGASDNSPK